MNKGYDDYSTGCIMIAKNDISLTMLDDTCFDIFCLIRFFRLTCLFCIRNVFLMVFCLNALLLFNDY